MAAALPLSSSSPRPQSPPPLLVPISSPSTLPLDLISPVRIVQKQVLHVRGHARGCTVALFMRLALPTSSKSRSFPLFPDEGVKLKSSAVYPVAMAKGGRSTIIPPDASNGLKRAAQALTLGSGNAPSSSPQDSGGGGGGEEQAGVASKQVKPRITSANFHITLVCPPLRDGGTADGRSPLPKAHYVAVIQLDVGLTLGPPRWPFEARIPIPRCLNNKLQFVTADDDDDDDDSADGFTVEFDPPLVQRPRPRKSESSADASAMDSMDSGSSAGIDEAGDECAISGPFPSSELMVARWAYAQAGVSQLPNGVHHHHFTAGRYPIHARALQSDAQILQIETGKEGGQGGVCVSLRIHLTLQDFHYAGLDQTAALYLAVEGGAGWLPDTLSVRSERAKLLHFWSVNGREESLMSRSSSLSTMAPTAETVTTTPTMTSFGNNDSSMLGDDASNLIDTQPPEGVADVSSSSIASPDDSDVHTPSATLFSPLDLVRRASVGSVHSVASAYSQKPLVSEHGLLCLLFRTSALRDAAKESDQLSFSVQGWVRMQTPVRVDENGTVHFACPPVVATHIDTHASLCSVTDAAVVRNKSTGQTMEQPVEISVPFASIDETMFEVVGFGRSEHTLNGLGDETVNVSSSSTVAPTRSSVAAHDRPELRISDESLKLDAVVPQQPAEDDVAKWTGTVEEASVKVWMSRATAQGEIVCRRAVNRLCMTWPRAWPGAQAATLNGGGQARAVLLLPTLVMAIPRRSERERIEVLHVSIHGEPMSVVRASKEDGIGLAATTSDGPTSTRVQLRLPSTLHAVQGNVHAVLVYSIEGGPTDAPHCLFAPVACSLNYLRVELFDEAVRMEEVDPMIAYSEAPLASSLQIARQSGMATLDASMLPAMCKVTLEYCVRTKAPVPLGIVPGAPVRRQSLSATAVAAESPRTTSAKPPPSSPSRIHDSRMPWTTILFVAHGIALAALLLHVLLTVLPATHLAVRKIDRIAEALGIDADGTLWKTAKTQAEAGSDVERSLIVKQQTGLAAASTAPPLLRVAAAWLSLVITWPYRMASLLWRR